MAQGMAAEHTKNVQAVEEIAAMTEENAAAAQQTGSSAQSLAELSQELAAMVASFTV